jgi:hypothetical protein
MRLKRIFVPLLAVVSLVALLTPFLPSGAAVVLADTYYVGEEAGTGTGIDQGPGSGAGGESAINPALNGKYYVNVDLYNASLNQTSMGNAAFERQALVVTSDGGSVIQLGTHPVEVSGYTTALTGIEGARTLQSASFTTNTKFDGTAHDITYLKVCELDLPDVTSQYLPVRIKVPYTPMDVVAADSDGWLSARLKIDWSSITKAPSDSELNPSGSIASGTSGLDTINAPAVSLADSATGIKLTAPAGVAPADAELKVSELTSGEDLERAKTALAEIAEKFQLFDISLIQKDAEIQPNGTITVSIPIPSDYDKEKVAVYRINDDGSATLIKGALSGGNYEIQLNRLSLYALVEGQTEEEEEELDEPEEEALNEEDDGTEVEEAVSVTAIPIAMSETPYTLLLQEEVAPDAPAPADTETVKAEGTPVSYLPSAAENNGVLSGAEPEGLTDEADTPESAAVQGTTPETPAAETSAQASDRGFTPTAKIVVIGVIVVAAVAWVIVRARKRR